MAALFQKRKKESAEKAPVEAVQALQETIVCPACGREINKKEAEKNLYVCYECGSYFRVRTRNRIRMVADAGTFTPWFEDLAEANPLEFPGYEDKVKAAKEKTGLHEALKRHSEAGLLYIPVLTDPTTGGVTASFAMLGDIILAEPGALIGFAGPRVIEQTIGEKLPEGFQRAQFQLEHGFVDRIVERKELKLTLYRILKLHHKKEGYANFDPVREADCLEATELMKERATKAKALSAWEKVKAARKVDRLASVDYIEQIFDEFMELHGDRQFRDDPAIVGGVAYLDGQPVTVIGVHKGKDLKECMHRNYGMPSPEGYRKALRLMKQAEKFKRPVITFVNTSGAFCGMEAEERGQGEAIARNLYEMSGLKVPVLCIMIGEGGSGGALALSVGNEVWMLENATYSILSPEGFASILWKDGRRAKEASGVMKITAQDLKALGVIEEIIPEYGMADQPALISISRYMKRHIKTFLKKQNGKTGDQLAAERYQRFRVF